MNDQIAQLNNRGVALLEEGELYKSRAVLKRVLELRVKQLTQSTSDRDADSRVTNETSHADSRPASTTRNFSGIQACLFLRDPKLRSNEAFCPFIYPHGVIIAGQGRGMLNVTSTILFNLGLVYHMKALSLDNTNHHNNNSNDNESNDISEIQVIQVAYTLYKKSFALLKNARITSIGNTDDLGTDLLYLALLNNLAHICIENGETSCMFTTGMASRYASELKRLASYRSRTNDGSLKGYLINKQKKKFVFNAMFFLEAVGCGASLATAA